MVETSPAKFYRYSWKKAFPLRIKYCNLAEFKYAESGSLDFTSRSKEMLVGVVGYHSIIDNSYAFHCISPEGHGMIPEGDVSKMMPLMSLY